MSKALPEWVAVVFTAAIFLGIVIAYRKHGVTGIAAISSQVAAITAVQLSTKAVMVSGFRYPMSIASLHLFCVCMVLAIWEACQARFRKGSTLSLMLGKHGEHASSLTWYINRFGPIAVLQCMNVTLNTSSLLYIGAGLNALVGILAPVLTALVAVVLGAKISSVGWIGIALAIFGDGIISLEGFKNVVKEGSTISLAMLGIGLGVLAMIARSVRSVLMDCQMNKYSADEGCPKLSPVELATFLSPLVFVFSFSLALRFEGIDPYMQLRTMSTYALSMLALSAACAVFLTIMGLVVIKMLGASAAQIAGKLNVLITVALSSAFLGESLTGLEILGGAVVLCGAGLFERAQQTLTEEEDSIQPVAGRQTSYQSA